VLWSDKQSVYTVGYLLLDPPLQIVVGYIHAQILVDFSLLAVSDTLNTRNVLLVGVIVALSRSIIRICSGLLCSVDELLAGL
jgi:hypothetical protein